MTVKIDNGDKQTVVKHCVSLFGGYCQGLRGSGVDDFIILGGVIWGVRVLSWGIDILFSRGPEGTTLNVTEAHLKRQLRGH